VFCADDLGGFYLDVLKDRLYTTAAGSHARRSAQTALWHITNAMLRWMAPFLSFTAEEAWQVFAGGNSILAETYWTFDTPDAELLARWKRIRELRDVVNKEIEAVRTTGTVGSSLQAEVTLTLPPDDLALMAALGEDLKFVFITSAASLVAGDVASGAPAVAVRPSTHTKCERCWHWRADVGTDAAHPALCGRCHSNLYGAGETRRVA
jgi:isoleucyl-tRNA synthetase